MNSSKQNSSASHWIIVFPGLLYVAMAIIMTMAEPSSVLSLAQFFEIMLVLSGVFHIWFSLAKNRLLDGFHWLVMGGILEIFLGVLLATREDGPQNAMLLIIGFWTLFKSTSAISLAYSFRKYQLKYWDVTLTFGILALIFSMVFLLKPNLGDLDFTDYLSWVFITLAVCYFRIAYHFGKLAR